MRITNDRADSDGVGFETPAVGGDATEGRRVASRQLAFGRPTELRAGIDGGGLPILSRDEGLPFAIGIFQLNSGHQGGGTGDAPAAKPNRVFAFVQEVGKIGLHRGTKRLLPGERLSVGVGDAMAIVGDGDALGAAELLANRDLRRKANGFTRLALGAGPNPLRRLGRAKGKSGGQEQED